MPALFTRYSDADLCDLIAENPLAWIVVPDPSVPALLMPLLLECDAQNSATSLLGHIPRAHPICAAFRDASPVRFLFLGPNSYISPEFHSKANWAPTWNFASAEVVAEPHLDDALTDSALERLVAHMETGRRTPWTLGALGLRYEALRAGVIGFRASILSVKGRFKLGQDESGDVFTEIMSALEGQALKPWMERFNAARGQ